jgi:hypothetical protein
MLISMPTGTSTIFGVFQAILALLANGTNSALTDKVMRYENFASEIFCHKRGSLYAAVQKEFTFLCDSVSNQRQINGFRVASLDPGADLRPRSSGAFRIKNL